MSDAIRGFSVVRITLEGMRHQIAMALNGHDESIRKSIEQETAKAFNDFDFAGEIRSQAKTLIAETIRASLRSAVSDAMWQPEIKKLVDETIREALKESIRNL